jgi:hypothetical protein
LLCAKFLKRNLAHADTASTFIGPNAAKQASWPILVIIPVAIARIIDWKNRSKTAHDY